MKHRSSEGETFLHVATKLNTFKQVHRIINTVMSTEIIKEKEDEIEEEFISLKSSLEQKIKLSLILKKIFAPVNNIGQRCIEVGIPSKHVQKYLKRIDRLSRRVFIQSKQDLKTLAEGQVGERQSSYF